MRRSLFAALIITALVLGCAGSGQHGKWVSSLDQAMSMDKPVLIEFSSPT